MVGAFNGGSLFATSLFALFIGSYHGLLILAQSFKAHGRLVKGLIPFFGRIVITGIMMIPFYLIYKFTPKELDVGLRFLII